MDNRKIAIIGSGNNSLLAAIAFANMGFSIDLYIKTKFDENIPAPSLPESIRDGRAIAIAKENWHFFERLAISEYLLPYAQNIMDIRVNEKGSRFFLDFGRDILNDAMGYIIPNEVIWFALYQKLLTLPNINIMIKSFAKYEDLPTDCPVIISEGKSSLIRKLSGLKACKKDYDQIAIVTNISHEFHHNDVAHEIFTPNGPFAILPLIGGYLSSIVWVEKSDIANKLLQLGEERLFQYLKQKFGHSLGKINRVSKVFSYPIKLEYLTKYYTNNLLFIGDSAHSIHPIAGQGFNLGIRDIRDLCNILVQAPDLPIELIYQEFQNKAFTRNMAMILATDSLNSLFTNNLMGIKMLRNLGLGITNLMPVAKRFFISNAAK